jgi:hypothetical protein
MSDLKDLDDTESGNPKYSAPKNKACPYCGQAFTSSSLGRHLDLYIKEKNPKPPDGIHDIEAIKKLRGCITRRQPRASMVSRRDASTPVGTPNIASRVSGTSDAELQMSPALPKDGEYAVDSTLSKYPFTPGWEATGVINDLPHTNGVSHDGRESEETHNGPKRSNNQRGVSRQVAQKVQFDMKQKLTDSMDTARAAELALRELLSSWRAAK